MTKTDYEVGQKIQIAVEAKEVTATVYYVEPDHPSGILYFATYNDPKPIVLTFIAQ